LPAPLARLARWDLLVPPVRRVIPGLPGRRGLLEPRGLLDRKDLRGSRVRRVRPADRACPDLKDRPAKTA
jgi:hypothetical protein